MKFKIDHNFHIHTYLSSCSDDINQTVDNIVKEAINLGYKNICITDHFRSEEIKNDMKFYDGQDYKHIIKNLPLKKYDGINVYFGAEIDLSKDNELGITKEDLDKLDFIIISTTHFHLAIDPFMEVSDLERSRLWLDRFNAILDMDLPFDKIGIAHLTCSLIKRGDFRNHVKILDLISDIDLHKIFKKAASKNVGIEINVKYSKYLDYEISSILRIYKIALEEGNKFYLGGDEHHLSDFDIANNNFRKMVEAIGLTENNKFLLNKSLL